MSDRLAFYHIYLDGNALAHSRLSRPDGIQAPTLCSGRNIITLAGFPTTTRRCAASPA